MKKRSNLTSFQIIILGFSGVILLGALVLMLPVSSAAGTVTPFQDTLFTATSAVCVTGLVVHDTATYWSTFGQAVILVLIQIGGMGVITVAASIAIISGKKISLMQRSTMQATYWSTFGQAVILVLIQIGGMGVITVAASIAIISGKKISLMQRSTMQEAIAAPQVGGIVRLTGFIVRTTLTIELLGAVVMAPVLCRDFGLRGIWMALFHSVSAFCNAGFDLMGTTAPYSSLIAYAAEPPVLCRDFGLRGIWMALFHSVSAFCNAGFDLMGTTAPYSSLIAYAAEPVINCVIMALIVVGGIGFLTWDDIRANGWHVHRYKMQSKVILTTTAIGFLTWDDIRANGWHVHRYKMQSKVILTTTAILLVVPAVYFFVFEFQDLPITWDDIRANGWHVHRYKMQSKVILTTTAILLVVPAVYFFVFEFQDLPMKERILASLFQSVTPRTAGFNTVDLTAISEPGQYVTIMLMLIGGSPGSTAGGMKTLFQSVTPRTAGFNTVDLTAISEPGQYVTIMLMLIGGSPGSTAGGMKTTTLAVLLATALATFRRKEDTHFYGRRPGGIAGYGVGDLPAEGRYPFLWPPDRWRRGEKCSDDFLNVHQPVLLWRAAY